MNKGWWTKTWVLTTISVQRVLGRKSRSPWSVWILCKQLNVKILLWKKRNLVLSYHFLWLLVYDDSRPRRRLKLYTSTTSRPSLTRAHCSTFYLNKVWSLSEYNIIKINDRKLTEKDWQCIKAKVWHNTQRMTMYSAARFRITKAHFM